MSEEKRRLDIHTRHCQYNACKYGEEVICSVYLGWKNPENPDPRITKPLPDEFRIRNLEADQFFEGL